jgi:hypothetical protein
MTTKELEKKLEEINAGIATNRSSTEDAEKRKQAASIKLTEYKSKHDKAREDRQGLLASGKDVKKQSDLIKGLHTEKELAEDEVIGLDKMLDELKGQAQKLDGERIETERDILKSKLIPLVPIYNEAAAKLAKIVEEIWELRFALNEPYAAFGPQSIISAAGWDESALCNIPKLFRNDEEIPAYNREEAVHFHYRFYRENKMRIIQQRREASRVAVSKAGIDN